MLAEYETWYVRRPSRSVETRQPEPNCIPGGTRVRLRPPTRDGGRSRFHQEFRNRLEKPFPLGQMTDTRYPASRSAHASFQTRLSRGTGRFSTTIQTAVGIFLVMFWARFLPASWLSDRALPQLARTVCSLNWQA